MKKLKIKIVRLGNIPKSINFDVIKKHKSSIFEIVGEIDTITLGNNSLGRDFNTYSCDELYEYMPESESVDIVAGITYSSLPCNFFGDTRGTKAILSLRNIANILEFAHISLENAIIKMLYEFSIGFDIKNKTFNMGLLHDETRGCIFDMNGVLEDVVFSFDTPTICVACQAKLLEMGVPTNIVDNVLIELQTLKKPRFYRIKSWIKENPWWSLFITACSSFILNILASWIYDLLKCFSSK